MPVPMEVDDELQPESVRIDEARRSRSASQAGQETATDNVTSEDVTVLVGIDHTAPTTSLEVLPAECVSIFNYSATVWESQMLASHVRRMMQKGDRTFHVAVDAWRLIIYICTLAYFLTVCSVDRRMTKCMQLRREIVRRWKPQRRHRQTQNSKWTVAPVPRSDPSTTPQTSPS